MAISAASSPVCTVHRADVMVAMPDGLGKLELQSARRQVSASPLVHQLEDATRVARFFARHWRTRRDPKTGTITLPGLETVGSARLPRTMGQQIESLVDAVGAAHEDYVRTLCVTGPDLVIQAHHSLWELRSMLEWILDELPHEQDRDALRAFLSGHWFVDDRPQALAEALEASVAAVREHLVAVRATPHFELRELDRAHALAETFSQLAASGNGARPEAARALATRNRLLTLLSDRVRRVRAAAKYVYRQHPETCAEIGI